MTDDQLIFAFFSVGLTGLLIPRLGFCLLLIIGLVEAHKRGLFVWQ